MISPDLKAEIPSSIGPQIKSEVPGRMFSICLPLAESEPLSGDFVGGK